MYVRVAIPEWGWRAPLNGGPSWSKRSRNTNGFRISPKSDALIKRVTGPCLRPRTRFATARATLRDGDFVRVRVIGFSYGDRGKQSRRGMCSGFAHARRLQRGGPPQEILDHDPGRP